MKNNYILLRHGQTIYQTKKKGFLYPIPEKKPVSLTKKGKARVKKSAEKLKGKEIDLIFSSDLYRTRQTAEIVAKELGLKVNFDKRLRDINFGIFQDGKIENYQKFFLDRRQKFFKRPSQGENWRDVKKRMTDFIKDIERKYKNKTILIVSHGDPLWLLCGVLKGLSEKEILKRRYEGFRPYKDFYPDLGQFLEL